MAKAGDRETDLPRTLLGFAVGLLIGMAVVGLVWLVMGSGNGAQATGANDRALGDPALGPQESKPAAPTRLQVCRRADARTVRALQAAEPALSQWEIHVGAMNKLVAGAITLPQATAFWNQTRVAARQHLDDFRQAAHHATSGPDTCSTDSEAADQTSASATPRLRSCQRRVAADRSALASATTAIDTWASHVEAMDMLRMGHLSAAKATQMWVASWHEGMRQIEAYHQAVDQARGSGLC
jgi:hypothetical protein